MTSQPRPIVVGVDGSDRTVDALALAALLGAELGSRVLPVHVAKPGAEAIDLPIGERSALIVEDRSPAAGLRRAAAERDAAMLVLGSSGRSRIGRVFPGGTAERLLATAPCPVAIAPLGYRDETPGLDTIALGFDGSDESLAALRWAEGLVHATDSATLRLIGVYDFVTPTTVAAAESMPVPGLHEVLRRRLSETVSSARAAVSATHRVESNVVDGTAPRALARESEHADLLIVGSRGSGPVLALLAGSVSTALVGMAACPVVVVPREWGS